MILKLEPACLSCQLGHYGYVCPVPGLAPSASCGVFVCVYIYIAEVRTFVLIPPSLLSISMSAMAQHTVSITNPHKQVLLLTAKKN